MTGTSRKYKLGRTTLPPNIDTRTDSTTVALGKLRGRSLIERWMLVAGGPQPGRMPIVGIWIRIKIGNYLSEVSHGNLKSYISARQELDRTGDRIVRLSLSQAVLLYLLEIDPKLLHNLPDPVTVFRHAMSVAAYCRPVMER